jgi:hypothetical protein
VTRVQRRHFWSYDQAVERTIAAPTGLTAA